MSELLLDLGLHAVAAAVGCALYYWGRDRAQARRPQGVRPLPHSREPKPPQGGSGVTHLDRCICSGCRRAR